MNIKHLMAGTAAVLASGFLYVAPSPATAADAKSAPPSAKAIRGASTYVEIENEPPPKLFVDAPLPEGLAQGIVWIQYRVENLRIVPVFGKGATNVSPRVGHLHITVDDLPWWWADASDNNTIDIAGLPPGEHTVRIELVDPNHKIYETKVVKFNLPVAVEHEFHKHHQHHKPAGEAAADPSHADLKKQVADSERAFAATMKDRDHAALNKFVAEDAIFFADEGTLRGREEILKAWRKHYEGKKAPFSWGPDQVEVFPSGKLAYSGGTVLDPAGKPISRFSSIWRLEPPGRWKIIFDRAEPLPNKKAAP